MNVARRRVDAIVYASLALITVAIYLPYSLKAGWYYDDWSLYTQARDAVGGWGHQISTCSAAVPGGRSLACVYHVTEYDAFGSHRSLYHLWVIVMLIAIASMAYAILKRCRLGWPWAWLISVLMLMSPVSDSARLWSVAAIGQIVIALQLAGVLVALAALDRTTGRGRFALHALAAFLFVLAMVTYEIAVPLVALNIFIYFAALRDRRALMRGAVDIALAVAFLIYRIVISPASADSGLAVKRTLSGDLTRVWTLIKTAWSTWHTTYAPGVVGTVVVVVVIAVTIAILITRSRSERRLAMWSAVFVGSTATSVLCTLTFTTANDLYLPAAYGTFNRLNLPATLAYAVMFVALIGMAYEVISRMAATSNVAALRWIGATALGAAVIGVGIHQLRISATHKTDWEASWRDQRTALAGYRTALASVPRDSRLLGFDTPEWEAGFVPVFAASWDLRGAVDYTTRVDPPAAVPFAAGAECGPSGVTIGGVTVMPYVVPSEPLYAVSPLRKKTLSVSSQRSCQSVVKRWGPAPFWGSTVTGRAFTASGAATS